MIHEFKVPIAVMTPHGNGDAILFIDYGINVNSVWVVRLNGGTVKHYYSDDIHIYDNPMNGRGWDIGVSNEYKQYTNPNIGGNDSR